jgi:ribosomal protein S18 acetylase RimI-like enzyme
MLKIRRATKQDLRHCASINPSFISDEVWQIREHSRQQEVVMTFHPARLPRPIRVDYPRHLRDLPDDLESRACLLIAEDEEENRGFVSTRIINQGQTGWIKHLVVDEAYRRQGIGRRLLQAAIDWSEYYRLRWVMAECQTKNAPAIALYQSSGLVFSGYSDMRYPSRDIALFFSRELGK